MWQVVRWLPEPVAFALGELGGRSAHALASEIRGRVRENIARVVTEDELDDVVRAAFRSYARYWIEAFRAADISVAATHDRTVTSGFHHLDGVLEEGRGVIVLLAHHGSWDMAARWAESHDYHLAVVAEVLRPRQVFERFVRLREAIGLEIVPLTKDQRGGLAGGANARERSESRGSGVAGRLSAVLDANHLVGLLTDRDLSGRAPLVDFFGEPTRIPLGAAVLASRKDAPIVPITMLQRPGRRWHLHIEPPIRPDGRSVRDVHADVATALENIIRLDPTQWHAFQPVWPQGSPETGQ